MKDLYYIVDNWGKLSWIERKRLLWVFRFKRLAVKYRGILIAVILFFASIALLYK